MSTIYLSTRGVSVPIDLFDTSTATKLLGALPFASSVNTWGDEIYFRTPVSAGLEQGAKVEVDVGDVAYWPPGQAMCVFFGPTPASTDSQPRAASPVTRIGRVQGDLTSLRQFVDGDSIRVTLEPLATE